MILLPKGLILPLTPNALLDQEYDQRTIPYLEALRKISQKLEIELVDIHRFFEKKFASGIKRESCFHKPLDFLKIGRGYKYLDKEELYLHAIVHPNQKGHLLITQALMDFR